MQAISQTKRASTCLAAFVAVTISGCGGGSDSSGEDAGDSDQIGTLDSAFVATQYIGLFTDRANKFVGHTVPLDLTMPVETRRGNPLTEVETASQEYYQIDETTGLVTALIDDRLLIGGHRAYLSDESFIDFGCGDRATITFAENSPNFSGSFVASYDVYHSSSNGGGRISLEFPEYFESRDWLEQMPSYAGFTPSMDVEQLALLGDLVSHSDNTSWPDAALTVGTQFASGLSVTRIERFGENYPRTLSVGDPSFTLDRDLNGCGHVHIAYSKAPLGFSSSSQPYRLNFYSAINVNYLLPFNCYTRAQAGISLNSISGLEDGQCDLWATEKGW